MELDIGLLISIIFNGLISFILALRLFITAILNKADNINKTKIKQEKQTNKLIENLIKNNEKEK